MAEFDPDAYLKEPFDPDAYLGAKPSAKAAPTLGKLDRFGKGLRDPVDAGAQLLTKMLPGGVVSVGNRLNNWLAENTGLVGALPEGGVDQQVREQEKAYQSARGEGFDAMRLAGNVLNPANLAIAAKLPQAATLGGRMLVGAGGGAASSIFSPVTEGDFASEKLKQAGIGAVGGGVIPAVGAGIARVVSPKNTLDPALQLLRSEGVRSTLGQTLGGAFNRAEERLQTTLPIAGDAMVAARRRAVEDLNRAAFSRALEPIGQTLPKGMAGRDAVEHTRRSLGETYDALLPKMTTQADDQFISSMESLRSQVANGAIDPNAARAFERIFQNDVAGKFQGQNAVTGETLKRIQSDLTNQIKRFGQSQDADQRLVGDALMEVQASLRGLIQRTNPKYANELQAIDKGYANFKKVQRAAAAVGSESGTFSPAQLQSAVKAGDRSKDKARFAEGSALMQDLSEAGKTVLGSRVPDSGTAGRLMYGAGALGLGTVNPYIPAGLLGGAALYTPPMQSLLTTLVGRRPQVAEPIAETIRRLSPALSPMGAQIGLLQ